MTVHKAKGLEFPVVILADMTRRLTPWTRDATSTASAAVRASHRRLVAEGSERQQDPGAAREQRKASASPTSPRRARAICSSFRRLAMHRTPKGGSRRSMARSIPRKALDASRRPPSRCPLFKSKDTVSSASGRRPGKCPHSVSPDSTPSVQPPTRTRSSGGRLNPRS
jgi:hypothetical protein